MLATRLRSAGALLALLTGPAPAANGGAELWLEALAALQRTPAWVAVGLETHARFDSGDGPQALAGAERADCWDAERRRARREPIVPMSDDERAALRLRLPLPMDAMDNPAGLVPLGTSATRLPDPDASTALFRLKGVLGARGRIHFQGSAEVDRATQRIRQLEYRFDGVPMSSGLQMRIVFQPHETGEHWLPVSSEVRGRIQLLWRRIDIERRQRANAWAPVATLGNCQG